MRFADVLQGQRPRNRRVKVWSLLTVAGLVAVILSGCVLGLLPARWLA
jgi:hypothetical protein